MNAASAGATNCANRANRRIRPFNKLSTIAARVRALARRGTGYLSQERSDFRRLTVWQNLQAILETLNLTRSERNRRAERLLDQYGLLKIRDQRAETLSGGERRKLEIARALVTQPKLILLDEPFTGVDPIAVEDLQKEILRLKNELGKSVLVTEHKVAEALRIC